MSETPLHPNLPLMLLQTREEVINRFRPILNHFGLTEQQWRILRVLRFRASMEPKEICEICLFLSPSLAGVLSRMEADGLIHKERMESDLRRVNVSVTDKGRALVDKAMPLIREQYLLIEQHIGRETLGELCAVLDRLGAYDWGAIPSVELPS